MWSYNVFTRRAGWRHAWTVLVESDDSRLLAEMSGHALTEARAYRKAADATRRYELAHR